MNKSLRMRTNIFIALMVALNPLGNALLRKGMDRTGAPAGWTVSQLWVFFVRAFQSGAVWSGVSLLLLFFVCQMLVLSWADYSYVLPASATSYVVVGLLGWLFLGEHIPAERWLGIALICAGAVVVGRTLPVSESEA